jgi:dipeptidyl aminopeptidase/acylaminoacyl peptidase
VATLETADASQLPSWWRWPKPAEFLAADGKTRTYGLVFRPSDCGAAKRYPVVDYVYGGPQAAYVPKGFGQSEYRDAASLAELRFVTIMIDGRGTVQRSRAFHEESYGRAEHASDLEDHIAAIRQLAATDPAIDATRVGITGFSAGGYLTASAMLRYPDFYSVGVAMSGSHDFRLFWGTWASAMRAIRWAPIMRARPTSPMPVG